MNNNEITDNKDQAGLKNLLDNLPTLPEVATRMLALNPDNDNYYDEILSLASQDPFIAAKIIQLANSAANAGVTKIASIQQAVARVGTSQIKTLATSVALSKAFKPANQDQKNLWLHAIQTAVYAKQLARLNQMNTEQAYLCGLMHDIGRIILLKEDEKTGIDSTIHTWAELMQNDRQIFGYSHGELSSEACRLWGLPESICEALALLHSDEKIASYAQSADKYKLLFLLKTSSTLSLKALENKDKIENEAFMTGIAEPIATENQNSELFFTPQWAGKNACTIMDEAKELGSALIS